MVLNRTVAEALAKGLEVVQIKGWLPGQDSNLRPAG